MNIDGLISNFRSFDELKVFCESQFKQILALTKKNKELEDKITDLNKKAREQNKQELIQKSNDSQQLISPDLKVLNDAKTISQVQLRMIKDLAFDRELTLEEAKRVEIFNRILNESDENNKNKTLKADAKVLNNNELLKLVESNG